MRPIAPKNNSQDKKFEQLSLFIDPPAPASVTEAWLDDASAAMSFDRDKLASMTRKERRSLIKERGLMKQSRKWGELQ